MKKFAFVLLSLFHITAEAALHTDTHTYIVSHKDGVLMINKQTGVEEILKVGIHPKSMVIYNQYGYVLYEQKIVVVDLQVHQIVKEIHVTHPISMEVQDGVGYVLAFHSLCMIDLKNICVKTTWHLSEEYSSLVVYGDYLYMLCSKLNFVSKVHIKTSMNEKKIPVGHGPIDICLYKHKGYVINAQSDSIAVLDLSQGTVNHAIAVGKLPTSMTIHQGIGYVTNRRSESVTVIDLDTPNCVRRISLKQPPIDVKIHGCFGYSRTGDGQTVSVFDIINKEVLGEFANPGGESIDFSDTHMYAGIVKKLLLPSESHVNHKMANGTLMDYVSLNPTAFSVGAVPRHRIPQEMSPFEQMDYGTLIQIMFNDHYDLKLDAVDVLSMLLTMKYPVVFLKSKIGQDVHRKLYIALFQAVWLGQTEKAHKMVHYFLQLEDPVIKKLVRLAQDGLNLFSFLEPKLSGDIVAADPDVAFRLFVTLLAEKDLKNAKQQFEVALFHCHPKACAIAAYLYLTNKVTDSEGFWSWYLNLADKEYFSKLCQRYG